MVPRIRVRLSTHGRATARHGAGVTTAAAVPKGLLSKWSFNAMARLYEAGQQGLALDARETPSWNTLVRLRNRQHGSFLDEFVVHDGPKQWRVRLTEIAHQHYERHYRCYAELFPDIDAPAPPVAPEDAHQGLADHRVTKPRHLLGDTDLRVLAELVRLHHKGTCHLQQRLIEEYARDEEPIPDAVATLAPGLLRWQVKRLAGSDKPMARLSGGPQGQLAQVIDAPNGPFDRSHPTLPLLVITDLGREHFRSHRGEYRQFYPDIELPDPTL